MDYVRQSAINGNSATSLTFDQASASYQSAEVNFADRIGQLIAVDLRERYNASIQLNADFDSDTTISFDVEGVPMIGKTVMTNGSITLSAPGVTAYHVIIGPGTGYTSVLSADDVAIAAAANSGATN